MPSDFDLKVIEEFRDNGGHVGGPFEHMSLLILHHQGARSGESHLNPLAYLEDDGRYVIFASKAGAPENPAWYHNLKAHPEASVEVPDGDGDAAATIAVRAEEATGAERERLYRTMAERSPQFADYETKTERIIPVMVLSPTGRP